MVGWPRHWNPFTIGIEAGRTVIAAFAFAQLRPGGHQDPPPADYDALCRLRISRSALDSYSRLHCTLLVLSVTMTTQTVRIHANASPRPTNGASDPNQTKAIGRENKMTGARHTSAQLQKPPRTNRGRRRQNHSVRLSSKLSTSAR